MKGPFSFWSFFGLTLFIDLITLMLFRRNENRMQYNKVVSVLIPVHNENKAEIFRTIRGIYEEGFSFRKVIVCGDEDSNDAEGVVKLLSAKYPNLTYFKCPEKSKAKKINYVAGMKWLGRFLYVRDCKVLGEKDCVKKMMNKFTSKSVAAVTSYGYLAKPDSFFSRVYHYGKEWINEIGKFRKNAQERRQAVYVVCGASTIYRLAVLRKFPMPYNTKTEDTHYTWRLQMLGFKIGVANNASVFAPDVSGKRIDGLKNQLKQSYRWSSGSIQCLYIESRGLPREKKLFYSTIMPGLLESFMYSLPLVLLPVILLFGFWWGIGFLVGDTIFSLASTLVIMPRKFGEVAVHYPQILIFKYLNAFVFLTAFFVVTSQKLLKKTERWSNEWESPETSTDP